jgi:hypothetical protein
VQLTMQYMICKATNNAAMRHTSSVSNRTCSSRMESEGYVRMCSVRDEGIRVFGLCFDRGVGGCIGIGIGADRDRDRDLDLNLDSDSDSDSNCGLSYDAY